MGDLPLIGARSVRGKQSSYGSALSGNAKSFLLLFLGVAIVAILLSALPTVIDVHKNQQSEFCIFSDGRELVDERTGECVPDKIAVAGRFLLYFAFVGGALLGPFGLYVLLASLKKALGR